MPDGCSLASEARSKDATSMPYAAIEPWDGLFESPENPNQRSRQGRPKAQLRFAYRVGNRASSLYRSEWRESALLINRQRAILLSYAVFFS